VIVIDFSIEDSINKGDEGTGTLNTGKTKAKLQQRSRGIRQPVKTMEPEPKKKEEQIMETRETTTPVQTLDSQAQTSEAQVPVSASESIDSQYKTEQAIQANFLTSSGKGIEGKWGDAGISGKGTNMASSGGYGNGDSDILNRKKRYLKENFAYIRDLIQRKVTYPKLARQMGWEGKVTVSFIVKSDGNAKDIKIKNSSGIEILDRSSIDAIEKASPFPRPPAEAQIIIPISYRFR
jgi:TonB family protein